MITGMLFFHLTVVSLFLFFFVYKTVLLIINKKTLLHQIQAKIKVLEIILGISIIVTGIYLFFSVGNFQTYLVAKIVLVILAIPLGIISLQRENKVLSILSLLIFAYVYGISETESITLKNNSLASEQYNSENFGSSQADEILNATQSASLQQGKVIYKVLCAECHGEDGEKLVNSSANLSISNLNFEEKVKVITKGKGSMRGYEPELSEQEIELVTAYTETLKE